MGLFRLLTFILVVLVAWRMIKNYQASLARRSSHAEPEKVLVREKIVKCELCDIHIPREEAIAGNRDEVWFCSQEHKNSFKQKDV